MIDIFLFERKAGMGLFGDFLQIEAKSKTASRKCLALSGISDYKFYMETAAIILAAGKGTRLNSALPKPLHHIAADQCWHGR